MRLGTAIECLVDNYRYASDKEWIRDKVAWALYHTWKEADRKTENSSEKPNNSTSSKMEQVETMSCAECKHRPIGAEICEEPCHYEPQTDCSWK